LCERNKELKNLVSAANYEMEFPCDHNIQKDASSEIFPNNLKWITWEFLLWLAALL